MTLESLVRQALDEDAAHSDIPTSVTIPSGTNGRASFLAKRDGVVAGLDVAAAVFKAVDPFLKFKKLANDGTRVPKGAVLAEVQGSLSSILRAERVALNFLQRLSGIATETARYLEAVSGTKAVILDTRKTTPGLRALEKYAVTMGGAHNHRMNLSDGILIKDNHIAALKALGISLGDATRQARAKAPRDMKVEVEVTNLDEVRDALDAGADILLLDNMPIEMMRQAVQTIGGHAKTEASGGIDLSNVRAAAETGVDFISIGALTHSVKALDISLEFEEILKP